MSQPVVDLLLLRHGETTFNREDRWQGQSDSATALTDLGRAQARAAADELARRQQHPRAIITSDLNRARDTADIVRARLAEHGVVVPVPTPDPRLRELHLGHFEGLTYADAAARFGPNPFHTGLTARAPGATESVGDLLTRALAAFGQIAFAHATARADRDSAVDHESRAPLLPSPVLIVSHGGVIRTTLVHLLGLDHATRARFTVSNGGLTRLRVRIPATLGTATPTLDDLETKLIHLNDTPHHDHGRFE